MTLSGKSKRIAVAFTAICWMGMAGRVQAAPGAGSTGGGVAGGGGGGHGGGAAPSGGGGQSHASSPAPTAQSSHESSHASGSSLTPPGTVHQPAISSRGQNSSAVRSGEGIRTHSTGDLARRYRRFNGDGSTGNYYSYPYWPYAYGYNGWYGDNNPYNQSPFYYPGYNSDNNNNNNNNNGTDQTGTYPVPGPEPTTAPTAGQQSTVDAGGAAAGSPNVAAQIDNAVDKSPAMVAADNSVQRAQSTLDSERQRVLAGLGDKPEYQQAVARRHEAAKDVRTAQSTSGMRSDAVVDAAHQKLDASDDVTKMQEQAVAADPAASAAKARLEQAVADRNELRAQLTAQMQSANKGR